MRGGVWKEERGTLMYGWRWEKGSFLGGGKVIQGEIGERVILMSGSSIDMK